MLSKNFITTLALAGFLLLSASAKSPYRKADNIWISLSGEIKTLRAGEFTLDCGDRVLVNGGVDYEFFEGREIAADYIVTLEDVSK